MSWLNLNKIKGEISSFTQAFAEGKKSMIEFSNVEIIIKKNMQFFRY
jgi:hypothetical protein